VAVILGVLFGLVTASPAAAGTTTDPPPALAVVEQTAWVTPDAPFTLVVDDTNASVDPAGTIRVRLRDAVANRNEFTVGLGEAGPGPVDTELVVPTSLARQSGGRLALTLGTDPDGPLPIEAPGVYPLDLAVDLRDGGTATLLTHLVRLPADDPRPPLRVATILPIGADPSVRPGGGVRTTRDTVDRIEQRISPLLEEPEVALTVVPLPETMESLTVTPRGGATVDTLAGALDGREVLAAPYVDLDEADWVASGLDEPLGVQATAGAAAVEATLDIVPNRSTRYLADPPAAATLPVLQDQGVSRLVVPASTIAPEARPVGGAPWLAPVLLTTEVTQLPAAVTDEALEAHAGSTGDPTLDAHRTLADLATVAQDRPLTPAGVVMSIPEYDGPDTGYVDTLMAGLDGGPLEAVTVSAWFEEVGVTPVTRGLAPRETGGLAEYRANLGLTHLTLAGFTALTKGADPSLDDLRRQELVSGSSALDPQPHGDPGPRPPPAEQRSAGVPRGVADRHRARPGDHDGRGAGPGPYHRLVPDGGRRHLPRRGPGRDRQRDHDPVDRHLQRRRRPLDRCGTRPVDLVAAPLAGASSRPPARGPRARVPSGLGDRPGDPPAPRAPAPDRPPDAG
jgi:hypothetical protein